MLDKIINDHLDEMDKIEMAVEADIDEIMKQIDIDAIMQDPLSELTVVVEAVKKVLEDEYIPMAISEGMELSKNIEKDREIIVPDTSNPKLNESLDDKG